MQLFITLVCQVDKQLFFCSEATSNASTCETMIECS